MKLDVLKQRREYFTNKANEAHEVECLLAAIRLGLAASGIHRSEFDSLLSSAIHKLKFIGSALAEEAKR